MSDDAIKQAQAESPTTLWHTMPGAEVQHTLDTAADSGLSAQQVTERLLQYGRNQLAQEQAKSRFSILLSQFSDFMILVLIAAAVLAGLAGDLADTLTILTILALNALIGFTQEIRAQKAMQALRKLAAPVSRVMREGQICIIPAAELVPGDIVILEAGNLVPADLRLLQTAQLQIDEAALTGESLPRHKLADPCIDAAAIVADRDNMAFKGTMITMGRGLGVVVATAMHTELGRIARLLSTADETLTPLQKRLGIFSKRLAISILLVCTLIFLAGLSRGEPLLLMLLTAVSLAVAAIPESLPAVVTIALALGAFRLTRHNALIRRLNSVETLGSITWICSDKTGTLTENRMLVEQYWHSAEDKSGQASPELIQTMYFCNDATRQDGKVQGDPTEVALLEAALSQELPPGVLQNQPRIDEIPFTSERMRMTTFHQLDDALVAYTKGAPEAIIDRCSVNADGSAWHPEQAYEAAAQMASSGMRVLAFALQHHQQLPDSEEAEQELQFLGLAGLLDPPRPEAGEAIATCRSAGIIPVMITGDHPATAMAIAKRLGLSTGEDDLLTGKQMTAMSDAELAQQVTRVRIYARMDPAQKIRIVKALQAQHQYVAMTGDGVNDAPALKQADIGVAMGKIGTDVAREAADIILLDDNFATIVTAIGSGRRIYDNIRRFIRYILTTNMSEVLLIMLAPIVGLPLPLLPIQILWINLVTDGLPGLALTLEAAEPDLMQRPPRPPKETLFARGLWLQVIRTGTLMALLVLGLQAFSLSMHWEHWQTLVFTALTFTQLANALVIRSEKISLFRLGLTSNPLLLLSLILTCVLHLLILYIPWCNEIFQTSPLSAIELLLCVSCAVLVMLSVELEKYLLRRRTDK